MTTPLLSTIIGNFFAPIWRRPSALFNRLKRLNIRSLFLLPLLAGGFVSQATAQTPQVLVSNAGESEAGVSSARRATSFTTGSNSSGYTLSSVGIIALQVNSIIIRTNNNRNQPGDIVATLTKPSRFTSNSLITFTAPAGTPTLTANTTYWVDATGFNLSITSNGSQNSLTGWNINRALLFSNPIWLGDSLIRMTVNGYANAATPVGVKITGSPLSLTELDPTNGTGKYSVVLNTDPGDTKTVIVTPQSSDLTSVTFTPASLTFTGGSGGDWKTAQEVTVTAIKDTDTTGETVTISHTTTSADTANDYHNISTGSVTVNVTDTTDATPPTVTSIVRQSPTEENTNANTLIWRVTFSETVTKVDANDFEITGTTADLTVASVGGSTAQYDVTASGGNLAGLTHTVTLSFAAGQDIEDGAANALDTTTTPGTNQNTFKVDNTAPTVAISGVPPTSNAPFTATFTFSEDVNGFAVGDITVSNGSAGAFTEATPKRIWTARITPDVNGAVTVSVPANVVKDDAGNDNTAATAAQSTYTASVSDNVAPTVTSIVRQSPTDENTNADTLIWRVTFSETVTKVDANDFEITGTTADLTVASVGGSTAQYDVTASGGNLAGLTHTVTLSFAAGQDIEDGAANALDTTTTPGTNQNTFKVDNTKPAVPEITVSGGPAVTEGGNAAFTLTATPAPASELTVRIQVADDGTSDFVSTSNEGTKTVTIPSGGTATYNVVTEGDRRDEGNGAVSLTVLADTANPLTYAVGDPASDTVTVNDDDDTVAPTVLSIARQQPGRSPTNADELTWRVVFSETVTNVDAADFQATGTTATLTVKAADDSTTYDVTAAGGDLAGLTARVTLALANSHNIQDSAGNALINREPVETTENTFEVNNTDPSVVNHLSLRAQSSLLSRFGRTVGQQGVDAVTDRLTAARSAGLTGRFAGHALPEMGEGAGPLADSISAREDPPTEQLEEFGRFSSEVATGDTRNGDPVSRSGRITNEQILSGTSFALTKPAKEGRSFGLWGRGSHSGFESEESGLKLDSEVKSYLLGMDWKKDNHLFGLMLARSLSEGDYSLSGDKGGVETELTALIPYLGYANEHTSGWASLGIGYGEMTFSPTGGRSLKTNIDWLMMGGGTSGALGSSDRWGGAHLRWNTDMLLTQTRSKGTADLASDSGVTTRLRFGIESRWAHRFASGGQLSPYLELGHRYDGGDAETGSGLEMGGGLDWSDPVRGLQIGLEGRTMVLHEDKNLKDWGVAFNFVYDRDPQSKRGLRAVLSHDFGGTASGGVAALLDSELFPGATRSDGSVGWSAEMAYGLRDRDGMVGSPYTRLRGDGSGFERMRVGYRIEPSALFAADMTVDLWAEPEMGANPDDGAATAGIELRKPW